MAKAVSLPFIILAMALSGAAPAAELVMFETPSCAWCLKWQKDVGQGYGATRAARLMPLRRVDVQQPVDAPLAALGVAAIPTFVVLECGREVGRIVGYSTRAGFWRELEGIAHSLQRVESDRC